MLALSHGRATLAGLSAHAGEFPDPMGLGPELSMALVAFAELGCALAVALGLFTRLAALTVVVSFAVAFFVHHAGDPFAQRELAFLYLAAFTAILLLGPGRLSADAWLVARISPSSPSGERE